MSIQSKCFAVFVPGYTFLAKSGSGSVESRTSARSSAHGAATNQQNLSLFYAADITPPYIPSHKNSLSPSLIHSLFLSLPSESHNISPSLFSLFLTESLSLSLFLFYFQSSSLSLSRSLSYFYFIYFCLL